MAHCFGANIVSNDLPIFTQAHIDTINSGINSTIVGTYYPLADTVEETVESRDVFITSGTNTIERNSECISSEGITVKYKKLR